MRPATVPGTRRSRDNRQNGGAGHAAQHDKGGSGPQKARGAAHQRARDQNPCVVERLVASLLARKIGLADDPERQRSHGRNDKRTARRRQKLGRQYSGEATKYRYQQSAGEDGGTGDAKQPSRPAGPIGERARRRVQKEGSQPDDGGNQANLRWRPLQGLSQPGGEEGPQPALYVANKEVDRGKMDGGRHADT